MSRCYKFVLLGTKNPRDIEEFEGMKTSTMHSVITYGELNIMMDLEDECYVTTISELPEEDLYLFRSKFKSDEVWKNYKKGWVFTYSDLKEIRDRIFKDKCDIEKSKTELYDKIIIKLKKDVTNKDSDIQERISTVIENFEEMKNDYREHIIELNRMIDTLNSIMNLISYYKNKIDCSFISEEAYDEVKFIIQKFN